MKKATSKCVKYDPEEMAREFPEEFAMVSNPSEGGMMDTKRVTEILNEWYLLLKEPGVNYGDGWKHQLDEENRILLDFVEKAATMKDD